MCGATIPEWLALRFEKLEDDPKSRAAVAVDIAALQCRRLREAGINEFHFYTLNRADLVLAICDAIGVAPAVPAFSN
jgi:methylenetetrahydrofolate reductase (NADPH)